MCLLVDNQAEASSSKDSTGRVTPKQMRWNPGGRELREGDARREFGMKKVLYAEERDGNSSEKAGTNHDPMLILRSPCFRLSCRKSHLRKIGMEVLKLGCCRCCHRSEGSRVGKEGRSRWR